MRGRPMPRSQELENAEVHSLGRFAWYTTALFAVFRISNPEEPSALVWYGNSMSSEAEARIAE